MRFFASVLKDGLPCWTVIQNWVLRYGLFRLLAPLPKREDWILILDHTIEFGTKTCLVVLAISREAFLKRNCRLRHSDMQVAAIETDHCSTGEDIARILTRVRMQMGCPAQIVSDAGANIKAGLRIFTEALAAEDPAQKTISTYDITHKTAILLKHLLGDDPHWNEFSRKLAETKRRVVHTQFAAYAPNKPKDKARWLNLEEQVKWAENILAIKGRHGHPTRTEMETAKKLHDYFGWVKGYRRYITLWRAYLDVLAVARHEVKENGLSRSSAGKFARTVRCVSSKRKKIINLKAQLTDFLRDAAADFDKQDIWLGTSDIIESVLGKYKVFSAKTPLKEIGKSVLTIPAFTSDVSSREVKQAMEAVSDKMLRSWLANNLGESLFARRKRAFSATKRKNCMKIPAENAAKCLDF